MTKEGLYFPLPFFIIAIALFFIFRQAMSLPYLYASTGFFYIGLFIMLFFRDPDRKIPTGEMLIIAPADGKIVRLEKERDRPEISIFLGIHNVHVNRAPVSGIIKSVTHHPGKFHAAFRDEAMKENERMEIEIETDCGVVRLHQVTGAIARRIICYKKSGDRVKAGDRIGLIRFGSRVDMILPPGVVLDIAPNLKVRAGETILGRMK